MKRMLAATAISVLAAGGGGSATLSVATAQTQAGYEARLASLPMDMITRDKTAGTGRVTAALSGKVLTVSGEFSALPSSARNANLRIGVAGGARGPVLAPLQLSSGTDGTITGKVTLTAPQIAALKTGRLYIQIDSEGAPDGHLWGWLMNAAKATQ